MRLQENDIFLANSPTKYPCQKYKPDKMPIFQTLTHEGYTFTSLFSHQILNALKLKLNTK